MVAMMFARRFRAIVIAMDIFAFVNAASGKELMTFRIHAIDTVCAVTAVINLHPNFTIGAIEVELAFLFTAIAFATAIHFLIVVVTFCMNSIMAVAPRFCKLASHQRFCRRW